MPVLWKSYPEPVRGALSLFVIITNTIVWCMLLFFIALIKVVIPVHSWRILCGRLANFVAQRWVWVNSMGLRLTKDIEWDIQGTEGLSPDRWYLLLCNHQSMVDIMALQGIFYGKVPMLKFFLKKELFWVPFLGQAWWALDFPFMARTSSARRDLETARTACEKFKLSPVTVMNFVEGTRFTPAKKEAQGSPYAHLLKPKVGGIAVVVSSMGEQLDAILDVTIAYPRGVVGLWDFLCGKSIQIVVRVKQIPLTPDLTGDFFSDKDYRRRFVAWLNQRWEEKDKLMGELMESSSSVSPREGTAR
jgi:1-acyl-sn-glycerol-3-phosphate acyltransferase